MTNFERIKAMTIEEMAKNNVRKCKAALRGSYDYVGTYTDYIDAWSTSDGYNFLTREAAISHELAWLKCEVQDG